MAKGKKIFIACDHAGFPLKKYILNHFGNLTFVDLGTPDENSVDYPDFADLVAQKVMEDQNAFGILICGSGQGMAMRANKFAKIRAALCCSEDMARLAREHNDANVLCLGSRIQDHGLSVKILDVFLKTEFAGGRHQIRVEKLSKSTTAK